MRLRKNVLRFLDIFSVTFSFLRELAIYYLSLVGSDKEGKVCRAYESLQTAS